MTGKAESWLAALGRRVSGGLVAATTACMSAFKTLRLWLVAALGPVLREIGKFAWRSLGVVWRKLGRLLLAVLLILPLAVCLVLAYSDPAELGVSPERMKQALWLSMSVIVVGVLWSIAWLACRLLARIVRAASPGNQLGPSTLSFLILWAFFPKLPKAAVLAVFWCAFQIVFVVPGNLLRMAEQPVAPRPPSVEADIATSQQPTTGSADSHAPGAAASSTKTADSAPPPTVPSDWRADRLDDRATTRLVFDVAGRFLLAVDGELQRIGSDLQKKAPLDDVAVALIVWFALTFLVTRALRPVSELTPQAILSRTGSALYRRWPTLGKNLAFLLVLACGAFLSLAAIISLPRLREGNKPNAEVSVDALRAELQQLRITNDQLLFYLPEDLLKHEIQAAVINDSLSAKTTTAVPPGGTSKEPARKPSPNPSRDKETSSAASDALIKKLDDRVVAKKKQYDESEKALDTQLLKIQEFTGVTIAAAEWEKRHADFTEQTRKFQRLAVARDSAQAELQEARSLAALPFDLKGDRERANAQIATVASYAARLRARVSQDEEQALADALSKYRQENINRQGSREQVQHFQLVRAWYAQHVADHRAAVQQCGSGIVAFRSDIVEWESRSRELLERLPDRAPARYGLRPFNEEDCQITYRGEAAPPDSPDLGKSLGAFKPVAAWLLDADSLPLTLIAGLLGFGLLGSVISTFVKAQIEQQKQTATTSAALPLVVDLTGVVLRGISAAVVLFLAVQGGLAVLSGAGADPNPYVLLLTCFIAAVFSERIWRKTLDYLTERLGEIKSTDSFSNQDPEQGLPPISKGSDATGE